MDDLSSILSRRGALARQANESYPLTHNTYSENNVSAMEKFRLTLIGGSCSHESSSKGKILPVILILRAEKIDIPHDGFIALRHKISEEPYRAIKIGAAYLNCTPLARSPVGCNRMYFHMLLLAFLYLMCKSRNYLKITKTRFPSIEFRNVLNFSNSNFSNWCKFYYENSFVVLPFQAGQI